MGTVPSYQVYSATVVTIVLTKLVRLYKQLLRVVVLFQTVVLVLFGMRSTYRGHSVYQLDRQSDETANCCNVCLYQSYLFQICALYYQRLTISKTTYWSVESD